MTTRVDDYYGCRVVVTGAAGAIGGHLTKALSDAGAEIVIAVDDLSAGLRENLPEVANVTFIEGSIVDDEVLRRVFATDPVIVFHLAALFANQNSIDHPELDLHVNGQGTLNVLQNALRSGASRFVFASTSCLAPPTGGGRPLGASMVGWATPYQITKRLGEQYCQFFQSHHGLSTVRVRFYNSYGPGELPGYYRNVIPNFFYRAMTGQPLPILGTGEETRDWTFVTDIVEGLLKAGLAAQVEGQVVNLGTGHETRVIDVARQINALTGNRAGLTFQPRRCWDGNLRRVAPISRTRRLLGHGCHTPLATGLPRTATWFDVNWSLIRRAARW